MLVTFILLERKSNKIRHKHVSLRMDVFFLKIGLFELRVF